MYLPGRKAFILLYHNDNRHTVEREDGGTAGVQAQDLGRSDYFNTMHFLTALYSLTYIRLNLE